MYVFYIKEVIKWDAFKILLVLCVILVNLLNINPYLIRKAQVVNTRGNIEELPLEINVLSTGKSDCIIIKLDRKYIVIDTGTYNNSTQIYEYLQKNHINKIEYLILTHNDKDHIGGAKIILDNIKVKNVIQADYKRKTDDYKRYIKALKDNNIKPILLHGKIKLNIGDIFLEISSALQDKYDKSNDYSIIVSIEYGKYNYLFAGDAEAKRMDEFISTNSKRYDVLKVPHHGIYNEMLEAFLKSTSPSYAIVTGCDFRYPDKKVNALLNKYKIQLLNTMYGDIVIKSDGNNIYFMQY